MRYGHRKSIRRQDYDYSKAGAYFITICAQDHNCLFGQIVAGKMIPNSAGQMIQTVWDRLPERFDHIELDEFVVMPNHIHGVIILRSRRGESCIRPYPPTDYTTDIPKPIQKKISTTDDNISHNPQSKGDHKDRPYGTLPGSIGRIVQAFKSITTHEYIIGVKQSDWMPFPGKLWQRNYWEYVVRNDNEMTRILSYIRNNPQQWRNDKLNGGSGNIVMEQTEQYGNEIWMV